MFTIGYKGQTREEYRRLTSVMYLKSYHTIVAVEHPKFGWLYDDYTYSNTTAHHVAKHSGMTKKERQKAGISLKGGVFEGLVAELLQFPDLDHYKKHINKWKQWETNKEAEELAKLINTTSKTSKAIVL